MPFKNPFFIITPISLQIAHLHLCEKLCFSETVENNWINIKVLLKSYYSLMFFSIFNINISNLQKYSLLHFTCLGLIFSISIVES